MEVSELAVRLIVLFLPGAIAAIIVDELTVHKAWTPFRFILNAIILGFLSYFTYQSCLGIICLVSPTFGDNSVHFWETLFDKSKSLSLSEVGGASVFSIIIGSVASAMIQHKMLHKVAKRLRISDKYGDENLYSYFLNAQDVTWVAIRDYDKKLIYEG